MIKTNNLKLLKAAKEILEYFIEDVNMINNKMDDDDTDYNIGNGNSITYDDFTTIEDIVETIKGVIEYNENI